MNLPLILNVRVMDWHWITLVLLTTLLMQYGNHMVRCVITDVQLVGGPSSNKGTVEIKQDGGDWETTCGMNIDISDVIVICKQLGFTGASLAKTNTHYGQNSTPAIGLGCDGSEGDLSACSTLLPTSGCSLAGSASCHGHGYLGCYPDNNFRVFSGDFNHSSSMSILYCIQFCKDSTTADYVFAGVENGYECYCGVASDNYKTYGVDSNKGCHVSCYGDSTESCGGSGYIAVFKIPAAMVPTMNTPPELMTTSSISTTSIVTSTNQIATTNNGDKISSPPSSPPPPPPPSLSSTSSSAAAVAVATASSSPPPPSSSPLFSSSLKPQITSNLHTAGNSKGLYAGIGGGVAAVVIIIIVMIVVIVYFRKRRSQRKKDIVSSQRATQSPASSHPAYDEIYDFGIPNGAMADSSSARGFQPGAQEHSSAKSRGHKKVLLVNLNPRKSSNIYEGTMDETQDIDPTSYASRGATAVKKGNDQLSVLYATPDKNGNGAQDGYDEINLGIAPYSSFENPKQPTASAKTVDRMSVVYAAPDKNGGRNVISEDMDSLYAMPDKNGNRNPSDDTSEDVGSLYAMPDKSRGKPDGYDGDMDLYAIANDSFSGDQFDETEMVDNELYTM